MKAADEDGDDNLFTLDVSVLFFFSFTYLALEPCLPLDVAARILLGLKYCIVSSCALES